MTFHRIASFVAAMASFECTTIYAQASDQRGGNQPRVLAMEQFHVPSYIPHYRIEINEDGNGLYSGYELVKNKGSFKFQITPTQAAKIFTEFKELGFWDMPSEFSKYKAPRYNGIAHRFSVKDGAYEKVVGMSVVDSSWPTRYLLRRAIEREVKSSQWRCPHMHHDSTEVCTVENDFSTGAIQYYESKKGALK